MTKKSKLLKPVTVQCNLCKKIVLKSKASQWVGHNVCITPEEWHCNECIDEMTKE